MNAFRNGIVLCWSYSWELYLSSWTELRVWKFFHMLSWNLPSACHQRSKMPMVVSCTIIFMSLRKKRHCQLYHDTILSHHANCERHYNFRDIKKWENMGFLELTKCSNFQEFLRLFWSFYHIKSHSNFLPYDSSSKYLKVWHMATLNILSSSLIPVSSQTWS